VLAEIQAQQRCFIGNYDVNPNGNTFVMLKDPEAETKLNVLWTGPQL